MSVGLCQLLKRSWASGEIRNHWRVWGRESNDSTYIFKGLFWLPGGNSGMRVGAGGQLKVVQEVTSS